MRNSCSACPNAALLDAHAVPTARTGPPAPTALAKCAASGAIASC
ncbi:MAG: hypothetical protein QM723_02905 [Myxococcaceae bacterium]